MAQVSKVVVFEKPACPQCTAVKRFLDGEGIQYEKGDAVENAQGIKDVVGFMQAPVTRIDKTDGTATFIVGFNRDALIEHVK